MSCFYFTGMDVMECDKDVTEHGVDDFVEVNPRYEGLYLDFGRNEGVRNGSR